MSEILKSIQFTEIDLETKEHGFKPVIQLRGGLVLAGEIMVSKSEIYQQRAAITEQAKRQVVDGIWRKLYGDIAHEWPRLRHDLIPMLDPIINWQQMQQRMDAFAKMFKRP